MSSSICLENENMNLFQNFENKILLPTNLNDNLNIFSEDSKEELQSKQPIKFILIKENPPQETTFLQKKTLSKQSDQTSESGDSNNGRWRKDEQRRFAEAVLKYGNDWKKIQNHVFSRNITQVRSHAQKYLMKLKESNFLKDKGLEKSLSWTKVMNFLANALTHDELKEVLFGVEQAEHKKTGKKIYKNLKKIKKNSNIWEKCANLINNSNNYANSETNNSTLFCEYDTDDSNIFNLNEEDKYKIKHKIINQEEEDKEILKKVIECFSPSSEKNILSTSFDEISFKEQENNNIDYQFLKE